MVCHFKFSYISYNLLNDLKISIYKNFHVFGVAYALLVTPTHSTCLRKMTSHVVCPHKLYYIPYNLLKVFKNQYFHVLRSPTHFSKGVGYIYLCKKYVYILWLIYELSMSHEWGIKSMFHLIFSWFRSILDYVIFTIT